MATSSIPRHLTDRDEEILLALDRCPLTVVQILKLSQAFSGQPFTSARGVQDRLHKLREADWVRSWPYAIANRGSPPDYFRLAYHLLVAIETTLLRQEVHTSWATVRETLATHEISKIVLPTDNGAILKIRKGSVPEAEQMELYRFLDVPAELIRPKKTWIHPPHQ